MNEVKLLPFLKWAGGKRWLSDVIEQFYIKSGASVFVEPFVGAGACALHVNAENTIINDINPHLINLYKHIQAGLHLDLAKYGITGDYSANRVRFNEKIAAGEIEDEEFAILFYVLNKTSFNGMCRYNKKGFFNVPEGDSKPKIKSDLLGYKDTLANWVMLSVDFQEIVVPPNAFLFSDSPYDDQFNTYWVDGFKTNDQERSIVWAGAQGVPVVLTNNPTDYVIGLLEENGFDFKIITKNHSIAADGTKRGRKDEVIAWKNCEAPDAVKRLK
ncbi:DNA adenine methylase [Vibrio splendidus]|nr:Dam family site-specific DNA-(adenine-N6)-methyltransferase [Vibrio splendidus]MCC4883115.1 Dam family site-specific DNA-(adenine-N6)-methyltransferase [Vibrio splendidus]